jgi:threonylcarbamoyladenosine tRNA methylthiotransferase MtaB
LSRKGYREMVLTGVDLASIGADLPGRPSLGALCAADSRSGAGAAAPAALFARPGAIDGELWRLIAEQPRFMPHLHLSLAIRRRSDPEAHEAPPLAGARRSRSAGARGDLRPGIALGADLIAGIPDRG